MTGEMELLETARRTIAMLRDTVTVLDRELAEVKTEKAGERLTMEAASEENRALHEEIRGKDAVIAHLKEENGILQERWNEALAMHPEALPESRLSEILRFYYRDFQSIDPKHVGEEDPARLYEVLQYLFKELMKAKILPKK